MTFYCILDNGCQELKRVNARDRYGPLWSTLSAWPLIKWLQLRCFVYLPILLFNQQKVHPRFLKPVGIHKQLYFCYQMVFFDDSIQRVRKVITYFTATNLGSTNQGRTKDCMIGNGVQNQLPCPTVRHLECISKFNPRVYIK